jgi:hypothetical protein
MILWSYGNSPRAIKFNDDNAVSLDDKAFLKIHARSGDHSGHALFVSNQQYLEKTVLPEAIPSKFAVALALIYPSWMHPL